MKHPQQHRFYALLLCLAFVCGLFGCVSRITYDELPKIAPGIEVASTCVRLPIDHSNGEFTAYNYVTRETISDRDPEVFRRRAKTTNIIYQFDPHVPQKLSQTLPWPYHNMRCETLSSAKTPKLPKGLWEIPLSQGMRDALVASLTQPDAAEPPKLVSELRAGPANKLFLGQMSHLITPPRYRPGILEEAGLIVRDTIRSVLPTVDGPDDKQISIVDTDTGQIIGGGIEGTLDSFIPAGAIISDAVIRSGKVPPPSNLFMLGKGSAEMAWGIVQMGVGGTAAAGGGGATMTGGGAIVGVPVCVAGVALAANGAATFVNGAKTVILAVCQWQDEAAIAEPQPVMAGPSPAPAPTPQPAAPPPPPAANPPPKPPAVKPLPKPPAKPAAQADPPPQPAVAQLVAPPPTQTVTKTFHNPPPGEVRIRNVHLAGKKHPKTGVPFDADGFPDFRAAGVVKKEVKITFSGNAKKDFIEANKQANIQVKPSDYSWHHHQDGTTMQLVPKKIHQETGHTGGMAIEKANQ